MALSRVGIFTARRFSRKSRINVARTIWTVGVANYVRCIIQQRFAWLGDADCFGYGDAPRIFPMAGRRFCRLRASATWNWAHARRACRAHGGKSRFCDLVSFHAERAGFFPSAWLDHSRTHELPRGQCRHYVVRADRRTTSAISIRPTIAWLAWATREIAIRLRRTCLLAQWLGFYEDAK
jgi:hypothetical protein